MTLPDHAALLANSLVVGVTGHRQLRPDDVPGLQARVRGFLQDLQSRFPDLPLVVLTAMAEGSDQLAAQVGLEMGLRVVAPLPLPIELYRNDFEDPANLALLERQLQQMEILPLPLLRGSTVESVSVPGLARNQQYARAGIFVSGHCHILLALWDGKASGNMGGTAQVVRYHLHGDMPGLIERRHAAETLLGPDQENIAYHLPVARAGEAQPADQQGRWLIANEGLQASSELPPAFEVTFERQQAFNVDRNKYAANITADAEPAGVAQDCPIWGLFSAADWLARIYQRRVGRVLRTTYVLVALMGITFFTYTHVLPHDTVIYGFLLLFLIGSFLMSLASRRQWERKYLDYRTLAEGLRVQSYWRLAGIVNSGSSTFAHDNFLQKQDLELGWIRNVMRGASLDGILRPSAHGAAEVDAVIREWIGTPQSRGQLAYYSRSALRRERQHRNAEMLGWTCIGLGVAISVVLAIFARQFDAHLKHLLVSVMGILSVVAAVHEAYVHKKADRELIKQYRFMQRIFGSAQRLLDGCEDLEERRWILRALGEAALTEHAEWTLMHRERPLQHSRI